MVWPFRRKRTPAKAAATPGAGALPGKDKAPTEADLALINTCIAWFEHAAPGILLTRNDARAQLHVGAPPVAALAQNAPGGAVLRFKRGKLHWIDLWDPALRETMGALVKELDKQQLWYFNGVIATKYDESVAGERGRA